MYRTVLCFRYVMSRFLTLVATLGVLLGVGVLIVVMAVMGGFVKEVREACRGGLSDVIVEHDVSGFPYYDDFVRKIKTHPNVAEATPVVQLYGTVQVTAADGSGYRGSLTKPCLIYGVRPGELAAVSKFREFLTEQTDDASPTFDVAPGVLENLERRGTPARAGCIPGIEMVTYHTRRSGQKPRDDMPETVVLAPVGARVVLSTLPISKKGRFGDSSIGGAVKPTMAAFAVVDYYKSRLYEFDSKFIFIPFEEAQRLGELGNPGDENDDDPPRAHQIRVRLHDYGQADATIADLELMWQAFKQSKTALLMTDLTFSTWEQRQAMLLSVANTQQVLMIILMGLIVVVAGFLIGAVLTMIVKEKTRDIGILKSLGASSWGVAQIFLSYAALVSGVGALLGLVAGKIFIHYIDSIEAFVSNVLNINVFPREMYYFERIPRHEDPLYMAGAVVGAIAWAVLCSAVASWRAARVQPVEALRYE